jgi:hypothetical protein
MLISLLKDTKFNSLNSVSKIISSLEGNNASVYICLNNTIKTNQKTYFSKRPDRVAASTIPLKYFAYSQKVYE